MAIWIRLSFCVIPLSAWINKFYFLFRMARARKTRGKNTKKSKRSHSRKSMRRVRGKRCWSGGAQSVFPAPTDNTSYESGLSSPSKMMLAQGNDYLSLHEGQHGGANSVNPAPAPPGYTGLLDDGLRNQAFVSPLDQSLKAIQGMSDMAGGRRTRKMRGGATSTPAGTIVCPEGCIVPKAAVAQTVAGSPTGTAGSPGMGVTRTGAPGMAGSPGMARAPLMTYPPGYFSAAPPTRTASSILQRPSGSQRGGAVAINPAPAPVGDTGMLESNLRAQAGITPIDQSLQSIQGMSDQSGGGRRRRKAKAKATRRGKRKNKASRRTRQRKMRGGSAYSLSNAQAVGAPGMLLSPGQEAKALESMNPEWKLATDPNSFTPSIGK